MFKGLRLALELHLPTILEIDSLYVHDLLSVPWIGHLFLFKGGFFYICKEGGSWTHAMSSNCKQCEDDAHAIAKFCRRESWRCVPRHSSFLYAGIGR